MHGYSFVGIASKALDLKNGDAKIIKNAGAVVSHPFGSIMRSILVAIYELKAEEVCVIGHHGCGMTGLESTSILEKAKKRGVGEERIDTLVNAGIEWLTGFPCVEESVKNSVQMIKNHPLLPENVAVHGVVICPETGKLDLVVDGYNIANSSSSELFSM